MSDVLSNNTNDIYKIIENIIITTFIKLNKIEQKLLTKYLYKTTMLIGYYIKNDNFVDQITMNDNQDIFSFLVLLMPYYDLNKSKNLIDLSEIFSNKDDNAKNFESSYYIDHSNVNIEQYFIDNLLAINKTLKITGNNSLANWLNIFPYTMENIKEKEIYSNFQKKLIDKSFVNDNELFFDIETENENFIDFDKPKFTLGYDKLLGTITNFLYNDIKTIKWMIYDVEYQNKIYPSIIVLSDILKCKTFELPYDKLTDEIKNTLKNNWIYIINEKLDDYFIYIKSVVLFYARWNNFSKVNIDNKCLNVLKPKDNENIIDSIDLIDEDEYGKNTDLIDMCVKQMIKGIEFENLYSYIFLSFQQFKYTWYGYSCMINKNKIHSKETYNEIYVKKFYISEIIENFENPDEILYITPKNIYNFMKSIIHYDNLGEYTQFGSYSWDGLIEHEKTIFIDRLNSYQQSKLPIKTILWFHIPKNLERIYKNKSRIDINLLNMKITDLMFKKLFAQIIFETLCYNGILTYFEYNPKVTNKSIMPDKNINPNGWKQYVENNVNMSKYLNSYNFLNNEQLISHDNYENNAKKTKWFANFGGTWVAQIQIFHHFINQRILYITGATGAGKSTVAQFMLLYSTKIINYNNNGKIVVTQPRTKPERGNAEWMAILLGVPIYEKDDKDKNEPINPINYFQFKDKNKSVTDEYYHPCLRIYTDGFYYQKFSRDYLLKQKVNDKYNKNNIFDMLLVDESHEHNTYMDLILTLSKFPAFINNQISLGIISATMENDEPTYRKYYELIDDNWKYPLNMTYKNNSKLNYNRNLFDRRIHLSIPFGGMNFEVKQMFDFIGQNELTILAEILKISNTGDILIFEPGQAEINNLIKKINEMTKPNVIAIPFYTNLNESVKNNIVSEIASPHIRSNFHLPKTMDINNYYNVNDKEKVNKNTYTRFIIVATNIAEASITIDTLKYVIDTGTQKNNIYNENTKQDEKSIGFIAKTNADQRKGRVGRTSPGVVYYTYDYHKLDKGGSYKFSTEYIGDKILNLITTTNVPFITQHFMHNLQNADEKSNFYFLKSQYVVANKLYNNAKKIINTLITYPCNDGGYDTTTLKDNNGTFFIIHPNETDFTRNIELKITDKKPTFENKINLIIEYYTKLKLLSFSKLTYFGALVLSLITFLMSSDNNSINATMMLLQCLEYGYDFDCKKNQNAKNNNEIIKNIILFIVFNSNSLNITIPPTYKTKADFLMKSDILPNEYWNALSESTIIKKIHEQTNIRNVNVKDEIDKIIINETNKLFNKLKKNNKSVGQYFKNDNDYKSGMKSIEIILTQFYNLKIKMSLVTNMKFINEINKNNNVKIIMENNNKITTSLKNNIQNLNNYEKTCYFVVENYYNNLLIKIPNIPYYTSYYNRNIYSVFKINSFTTYNKIIQTTNVEQQYLGNTILYMKMMTDNNVSDIMFIPTIVLKYITHKIIIDNKLPNNYMEILGKNIKNNIGDIVSFLK
jgi:hypothetical protein